MKKVVFSLLLVFTIMPVWAQQIDSLITAANNGDANAQCKLGECYYYGQGVQKNYKRAFVLFEKAAVSGVTEAQYYIGECYYKGRGVDKNIYKANDWLSIAWENRSALTDKQMEATEKMLAKTDRKQRNSSNFESFFSFLDDDNCIKGLQLGYTKRSIAASKEGLSTSQHYNIFGELAWSHGISLGLNTNIRFGVNSFFGVHTGIFLDVDWMFKKGYPLYYNRFFDIGLYVPMELALFVPLGDNHAILHIGPSFDYSLKTFYSNSNFDHSPISYGEQGSLKRGNISLAFGASLPLGDHLLFDFEYQKGFISEPLWIGYNSKIDKMTFGLTFRFGNR